MASDTSGGAGADEVDFEGLELIDIRLEIDVDTLLAYLVAHSDFPTGPAEVKQFNKGQSNPTYFIEARRRNARPFRRSFNSGALAAVQYF